jgi:hypothetical protein
MRGARRGAGRRTSRSSAPLWRAASRLATGRSTRVASVSSSRSCAGSGGRAQAGAGRVRACGTQGFKTNRLRAKGVRWCVRVCVRRAHQAGGAAARGPAARAGRRGRARRTRAARRGRANTRARHAHARSALTRFLSARTKRGGQTANAGHARAAARHDSAAGMPPPSRVRRAACGARHAGKPARRLWRPLTHSRARAQP